MLWLNRSEVEASLRILRKSSAPSARSRFVELAAKHAEMMLDGWLGIEVDDNFLAPPPPPTQTRRVPQRTPKFTRSSEVEYLPGSVAETSFGASSAGEIIAFWSAGSLDPNTGIQGLGGL